MTKHRPKTAAGFRQKVMAIISFFASDGGPVPPLSGLRHKSGVGLGALLREIRDSSQKEAKAAEAKIQSDPRLKAQNRAREKAGQA